MYTPLGNGVWNAYHRWQEEGSDWTFVYPLKIVYMHNQTICVWISVFGEAGSCVENPRQRYKLSEAFHW